MQIDSLRLWNFKNLHGQIAFSEGINLLVAANGFGKSNLLEAIAYLSSGSSFRRVPDELIWPHGQQQDLALIAAEIGSNNLQLAWQQTALSSGELSSRKKFQFNSKPASVRKFRQYLGTLVYAPTSIDLVTGQAKSRRDFLDETILTLNPAFYQQLRDYRRVVLTRNSLLQNAGSSAQLAYWNDKMVQLGARIIAERLGLLSALLPILEDLASEIYDLPDFKVGFNYVSKVSVSGGIPTGAGGMLNTGSDQGVGINLDAAGETGGVISPGINASSLLPVIAQSFADKLTSGASKELQAGRSLYGPHLDDIEFFLQGRLVRFGSSRGQQRLFGLMLHLAALSLVEAEKGDKLVLLLDDLFSELDVAHRQNTSDYIAGLAKTGQQVFITAPASDYIPQKIAKLGNKLELTTLRHDLI